MDTLCFAEPQNETLPECDDELPARAV